MRQLRFAPALIFTVLAALTACAGETSTSARRQAPVAAQATDYSSLLANLRSAGLRVEPGQPAEQPFLSVEGRMLHVGGEDVQVFQYPHAAALNFGLNPRRRLALPTTVTDEKAIAAPAINGLSSRLKNGNRTPIATGIPSTL